MYTITSPFGGATVVDNATFTVKISSGDEDGTGWMGEGDAANEIGLSTCGDA
jgi:hypothetical protein